MKKLFVVLLALPLVLSSCDSSNEASDPTSNLDSINATIASLEQKLYGSESASFDQASALRLTNAYINYQSMKPEDPKSGEYLFKAAELSMALGDFRRSLALFNQVYQDYPNFKNHPLALFYQASIYDDQINDEEKARELYEKFVENHPDHDFAPDARILIKHLGKSDEELLREFEKMNENKEEVNN